MRSTDRAAGDDRPGRSTMIETRPHVPDAPAIPGLSFRMFDPVRDYEAYADLVGDANRTDGVDYAPAADELRVEFSHGTEFDPRRDIVLALVDGDLVAAAQTSVRTRDGKGVHQVEGWVRPEWRRHGLGRALLRWTELRAAEVARVDGRPPTRALS